MPKLRLSWIQQQQQKFQAIREEHRRELIEKMASQVMQKVESELKQKSEPKRTETIDWMAAHGARLETVG